MKNIAFTWVYNDMLALELWAKYYSRYFDELLVLGCGTKPEYNDKLEEFKTKYNLSFERLEADEYDATNANIIVRNKFKELVSNHRWVLYSNCDEIVATKPKRYKDLKDFMKRHKGKWQWCLGYEILKEDDEAWLDYDKPILRQRKSWLKNPSMNKVLIGRIPLEFNEGQHQVKETKSIPITTMRNRGLYLLHLKHADYNAPNHDYISNIRPYMDYVKENWKWKGLIPEELKDLI